jgi:hypothetical protein
MATACAYRTQIRFIGARTHIRICINYSTTTAFLLAQHADFAGRRQLGDFAGEFDQVVGGVAPGTDDDDLMLGLFGPNGATSRRHHSFRVLDARPAEFLHQHGHREHLPHAGMIVIWGFYGGGAAILRQT